jgi:8-oxo-dGTP pyrophosphatase MutT (NUDIX family)
VSSASSSQRAELGAALSRVLLDPAEAQQIDVHGSTCAAVLVPLFLDERGDPHLVFTKRRDDTDADLRHTALREAHEEIGLDPSAVEVIGALQPTPTIATSFAVYPFVGLIEAGLEWTISAREVDVVLELGLDELRAGYGRRRMVRRGVPFRTDVYVVGDTLIWGATARILGDLLSRVDVVA